MSAPLTFTEKILKFEPIFKYVVKGGLVALGYRKYDRSVHQLQLYGSAQLDIMTQQTKNVEGIFVTLNGIESYLISCLIAKYFWIEFFCVGYFEFIMKCDNLFCSIAEMLKMLVSC